MVWHLLESSSYLKLLIFRGNTVIQIVNQLGLSTRFEEMECIDIGLATKIIDENRSYCVSVDQSIQPNIVIHGVMDN